MLAVEEAREIPDGEFLGEALRRGVAEHAARHPEQAARRPPVEVSRNAAEVGHGRAALPLNQAVRHAVPETPTAKVTLGQAFGRDIRMDDQVWQVESACAALKQALI